MNTKPLSAQDKIDAIRAQGIWIPPADWELLIAQARKEHNHA